VSSHQFSFPARPESEEITLKDKTLNHLLCFLSPSSLVSLKMELKISVKSDSVLETSDTPSLGNSVISLQLSFSGISLSPLHLTGLHEN